RVVVVSAVSRCLVVHAWAFVLEQWCSVGMKRLDRYVGVSLELEVGRCARMLGRGRRCMCFRYGQCKRREIYVLWMGEENVFRVCEDEGNSRGRRVAGLCFWGVWGMEEQDGRPRGWRGLGWEFWLMELGVVVVDFDSINDTSALSEA
ncbi:MAG: hypothetical protein Q9211_003598, partial [Gyalolechia sp. 1 TL-2023]